jgi:hypothetical protein
MLLLPALVVSFAALVVSCAALAAFVIVAVAPAKHAASPSQQDNEHAQHESRVQAQLFHRTPHGHLLWFPEKPPKTYRTNNSRQMPAGAEREKEGLVCRDRTSNLWLRQLPQALPRCSEDKRDNDVVEATVGTVPGAVVVRRLLLTTGGFSL